MCCLSRLFSGFIIFLSQMGGIPGSGDQTYPFVRVVGRVANMLDFFKYCFFTFGDYFVNGTSWPAVNALGKNAVWLQIVNPYDKNAEGRSYWMPNSWLWPTDIPPADQGAWQR